MIADKDRSYYIGASDVGYVMGRWDTKAFSLWWMVKQGVRKETYTNEAMEAGNAYEHKILDALNIPGLEKDKQIIKGRLRVNLDGNTETKIYEVKTHSASKPFKPTLNYIRQVNVQMYITGIRRAEIVSYGLLPEEYKNHNRPIDPKRIGHHKIKYDRRFIAIFEKRMLYLSDCLENNKLPDESEVPQGSGPSCWASR